MIGRFLLGSGLGALVGTGLLALASVVSPPPEAGRQRMAGAGAPSDGGAEILAPEGVVADVVGAVTDVSPDSEPDAAIPAVTDPAGDVVVAAISQDAPETETEATPELAPKAPVDALVGDTPVAEGLAETELTPEAPALGEAPSTATAPDALAGIDGDTLPQPTDTPAAAPDLVPQQAPDALSPPAGDSAAAAAPASDLAAPSIPADPDQPGAPQAETVPVVAGMPELPPLTPEEEALLRQIAEEGPGSALPPDLLPADLLPEVSAEPTPEMAAEAAPEGAETLPAPEALETDPAKQVTVLDPAGTPSTLAPAPALAGAIDGIKTNRLPRIGDSAGAAADASPSDADSGAADDRPLSKFAQAFDNPEGKPVFAIVLIDDGSDGIDRAALAALPFPVSFALDPTNPKAAEYAAIYRAGGQEVVILADSLFKGASASDVEVTLGAMAATLPEAVAVMDTPDHAFQGDRPLASLVVPVIGDQGRGVLSWDQGLNAADQVARREAVPSASAFRDLDGGAEATPVIRRYLDRAAFKAAQEGRVTVVGRTRPDTIAAILEWSVEGRAATVALAPISAVLTTD